MAPRSGDSYLKSLPPSAPYQRRIARYRMKGYHAESVPGEGNELDASAVYPLFPPWWPGVPTWDRDAAVNDSDKTVLTVSDGKLVRLVGVYMTVTCTATVGNRTMRLEIGNGTDVVYLMQAQTNITAGQTGYITMGVGTTLDATGTVQQYGISDMILPAGYTVRVYDINAIDPAADDLAVVLHYIEYDAP